MRAVFKEYADEYARGYADALADMRERRRSIRQQERYRQQRRWYFIKQRLCGLVLIAITLLAAKALGGDITVGVFLVPLGLYLIFTKEMCIINGFYWQEKERRQ